MAGRSATTFLKRQKEQQRIARANAKRADRQARRDNRQSEATTEVPDEASAALPVDPATAEPEGPREG